MTVLGWWLLMQHQPPAATALNPYLSQFNTPSPPSTDPSPTHPSLSLFLTHFYNKCDCTKLYLFIYLFFYNF
jgi:hypothetical protein